MGYVPADFRWLSPIGFSTILFMVPGALWVIIGILTPILLDTGIGSHQSLVFTNRTDTILFGASPQVLRSNDPALAQLQSILLVMVAALLVAAGIGVVALAWFGLRQKHLWALGTLTFMEVTVLPFWYLILSPYIRARAGVTLADVPPLMWVPTVLWVPATALGWTGIR